MKAAEVRKAIAAAGAAASVAVGAGLLTGQAAMWVVGAISTAAAFVATYCAPPNDTAESGQHEAA